MAARPGEEKPKEDSFIGRKASEAKMAALRGVRHRT
jgi:hypothetical protein